MVAVAQLVEPRIVIPVVAGSSPVGRPIFTRAVVYFDCSPFYFKDAITLARLRKIKVKMG